MVERAGLTGRRLLSVQSLGEFYAATVRKRLASPATAQAAVDDLTGFFPLVSPTGADVRAATATATAAAGRFSYRDALLLATLGRAGCSVVPSGDMHDGASLAGAAVRNPFAGDRLPADVEVPLA